MLLEDDVKLLKSMPLFAKIDPAKLKLIAFMADRLVYRQGDVIFKKGEKGENVLITLEGESKVLLPTHDDKNISILKKGEVIGEIAVLCNVPRTMSLIAHKDCVFLSLSKDLFIQLIREIPDLALQIIHDLARRLANTIDYFETNFVPKEEKHDPL